MLLAGFMSIRTVIPSTGRLRLAGSGLWRSVSLGLPPATTPHRACPQGMIRTRPSPSSVIHSPIGLLGSEAAGDTAIFSSVGAAVFFGVVVGPGLSSQPDTGRSSDRLVVGSSRRLERALRSSGRAAGAASV